MLGGQRRYATQMVYRQGRPYLWSGGNVSQKPDWDTASYVFKGTSNKSSYNYTQPGAYRDKSERAGSTGAYKQDPSLATQASFFGMMMNLLRPKDTK